MRESLTFFRPSLTALAPGIPNLAAPLRIEAALTMKEILPEIP
jgi:hypothetical protein